ncbi:hypothetical protein [Halopiger goleimassiliensis]|uniref:hypothetical protein n=1 Tax=Halopiger goleimassiliensis TaxID=1293048 RepID=UPI000A602805|nr:hypothetical protein [Halopiger goleimassiliensis]
MGLTIQLDEHEHARLSDAVVETRPPDRIDFVAEGVLTVSEALLGEFEGTTLQPTEVAFTVDGSTPVTVDLTGEPTLRLESVDVGVTTTDADELSPDVTALDPTSDGSGDPFGTTPGAIAFTVEGTIRDVPADAFASLSAGEATPTAITFALQETTKSDGGADATLLEITLLGYGVVVYRSGIIEIGTGGVPGVALG